MDRAHVAAVANYLFLIAIPLKVLMMSNDAETKQRYY
jgi:hypothetical protein